MATKVTYFAFTNEFSTKERPGGVIRRTENDQGEYDEAFTRSLVWERIPLLYSFERGNRDSVFYEIPEEEADRLVERIRNSVIGQP
jgi:hypothetical protein